MPPSHPTLPALERAALLAGIATVALPPGSLLPAAPNREAHSSPVPARSVAFP